MCHVPIDDLERKFLAELQEGGSQDIEEAFQDYLFDGEASIETADGCKVEPDGVCPHGYSSPLLLLGWI